MTTKKQIIAQTFDYERALYNSENAEIIDCIFAGPADGESVLKESREIKVKGCSFSLRYPLWHTHKFMLENSVMDDKTRAPLWYSSEGIIDGCNINGVKCLRECENIKITKSAICSAEFGWKCKNIDISNSELESEYLLFESSDINISKLKMKGKYSFQYTENMKISDSVLDTKDAFWHSKNVIVENSVVKGEYLGWYSEGLTLINCHIVGTQPLCYCKKLKLINCTMEQTDLAFEYSEVEADISGDIMSVKNAKSGYIVADSIGELIFEDSVMETTCEIKIRTK